MKLNVIDAAANEIHDATAYYKNVSDALGNRFFATVMHTLEQVEKNPVRYGHLETLPDTVDIRRALIPGFPYYLPFFVSRDEVVVLALAHASRVPNYWIGRVPNR
jgi:hypothetical protein